MTLAPEHELVKNITTPEKRKQVLSYIDSVSQKTERERQANIGKPTGFLQELLRLTL